MHGREQPGCLPSQATDLRSGSASPVWKPTVSNYGFEIWQVITLHGGPQSGSQQSQVTDLRSGNALTCMKAYSVGRPIWYVTMLSLVRRPTAWGLKVLALRVWDLTVSLLAWMPTAWDLTVSN